jgi:hypothetical protein
MRHLPTTQPGSYYLGYDTRDGLPVIVTPRTRILLAISSNTDNLGNLGRMAYDSAAELPNNQMALAVVTRNSSSWPDGAFTVAPIDFGEFACQVKKSQPDAKYPHALIILDNPDQTWGAGAEDIQRLAEEQQAVSILVLAKPDYAQGLISQIPETYMRICSPHEQARAPFLLTVYGQGSEKLAKIGNIPSPLPYGCFAYRRTSRWQTLEVDLPALPARIRQRELAVADQE